MTEEVDILVIGAGIAGAAAACAASLVSRRSSKARVLLVERSDWPRDKVCGCCLGRRGVAALQALGVPRESLLSLGRELTEVRVRTARAMMTLPLEGALAIGRSELDGLLVRQAVRLGVRFEPRCSAQVIALGAGVADKLTVLLTQDRCEREVRGGVVIAADGLAGHALTALPEDLGLGVRMAPRARMGAGVRAEWKAVYDRDMTDGLPPGRIVLCAGRDGYVGLVRMQDGSVDVAGAVDPRAARALGGPGPLMRRLLQTTGLSPEGPWPHKISGTGLLTRRRERVSARGLLVAGDAAGYVEPFTGEGMTWAALGGSAAGSLAAAFPGEEAAVRWAQWHAGNIRTQQRGCQVLSHLLRVPGLLAMTARAAGTIPAFRSAVMRWTSRVRGVDVPGQPQVLFGGSP